MAMWYNRNRVERVFLILFFTRFIVYERELISGFGEYTLLRTSKDSLYVKTENE